MRDNNSIGPWIRRFLLEHVATERNLAHNTQLSYRDTLVLLLPFLSKALGKPVDRLSIDDFSPANVRSFCIAVSPGFWCEVSVGGVHMQRKQVLLKSMF